MSNLFYREYGSGEPLIILHGLFGCSDNWIFHGKKLSNFFHVFLIDQRNHGNSPHSSKISYDSLSKDIYEFIIGKKLSSVKIIGHSMGGKVAMFFALQYPQFVDKLIVLDIAPKDYSINARFNNIIQAILSIPLKDIKSRKEADNFLSAYIPELGIRNFMLKNLKRQKSMIYKWKPNVELISKKINDLYSWDIKIFSSTIPTLFIRGENSNYIIDSDLKLIKLYFPNSDVKTIKNSGHWIHVDSPNKFYSLVLRTLNIL